MAVSETDRFNQYVKLVGLMTATATIPISLFITDTWRFKNALLLLLFGSKLGFSRILDSLYGAF